MTTWTSRNITEDICENINTTHTLANIARRARTLFADGYSAQATFTGEFVRAFCVRSPKGERYTVKLTKTPTDPHFGDRCTCPAFAKFGECKHHLALVAMVRDEERDEAMCTEYDALHAEDDDRYPEF